jgi:tRNA(Ile)-lysidine synthase
LNPIEPPQALCAAVHDCLGRLTGLSDIAVGLSGGPDSAALAVVSASVASRLGLNLHLLHVHHGLHERADDWMQSAADLARRLELKLVTQKVCVDLSTGLGVEAAARLARHRALLDMSHDQGIQALMTAHHAQDQAETVLLRLLRGTGVTGLGAIKSVSQHEDIWLLRPWLGIDRDDILAFLTAFSAATGWQPVDDPSNRDVALGRGALRETVIPALRRRWPAWHRTLSRHAQQAAEAEELLTEYGQQLLLTVATEPMTALSNQAIDLAAWRNLSRAQQALVLRVWLAQQNVPMPAEARLAELMRQLRQLHALGHDRALQWRHGSSVIRCIRGKVELHAKI